MSITLANAPIKDNMKTDKQLFNDIYKKLATPQQEAFDKTLAAFVLQDKTTIQDKLDAIDEITERNFDITKI